MRAPRTQRNPIGDRQFGVLLVDRRILEVIGAQIFLKIVNCRIDGFHASCPKDKPVVP